MNPGEVIILWVALAFWPTFALLGCLGLLARWLRQKFFRRHRGAIP